MESKNQIKKKSFKPKEKSYFGLNVGVLPKKYHASHAFCFYLHDLIVQTLQEGDKAGIFDIVIETTEEKIPSFNIDRRWIGWLDENGYQIEALILIFKQITKGLIGEFGHFTYEALDCSKKGKLSVTFTLFRKAFKDHLMYLDGFL